MSMPPEERLPVRRVFSHLAVMLAVAVVMGLLVAGLAIPFAGLGGMTAKSVSDTMQELPEELETDTLPQRTTILDSKGDPIASIYDQNRVTIPLDQVSRNMVEAMIAIEDYRFYQHGALDLKGTLRAFVTNQASDSISQGGSSITQQLVKLTLIQQANGDPEKIAEAQDDTYARKIRELRYAIALEEKYSKDWILERYLNTAYFGDGAYGVQAAAKHFFDVNAKDLNYIQAATLAGMVKSPNGYDPTNYPERAIERRNVVIDRMAQLGVFAKKRAGRLKKQGLGLDVQNENNGCVESPAQWYCDYVVQYLLKDKSLGKTPKDRRNLLKSGGLTIKTNLDMEFQRAATEAVSNHVYPTDNAVGALAMVEPGTGVVKAVAQSRPMGGNEEEGQTFLNYTIPQEYGTAAPFQVGSTAKPIVLAAALERGLPLDHWYTAYDPMTFDLSEFENCPGEGNFGGTHTVGNSTSTGRSDMRANMYSGTRLSINTFYYQLSQEVGICAPFNLAKEMGVRLTNPDNERLPGFTLGPWGASPLEMAGTYATFAARGLYCEPRPVTAIQDAMGNALKEYPSVCRQVMKSETADAVNDVLEGVIAPGGFADDQALDQPAAGKTGTTQDGHSVWFSGYTPNMATSAMIAAVTDANRPSTIPGKTIGGVYRATASGSGFAAPMWGDAMQAIDHLLDYEDFVFPTGVIGAGETNAPAPPPAPRPNNGGGYGGGGDGGGGNGGNGGNGGGGNGGGRGNGGRG